MILIIIYTKIFRNSVMPSNLSDYEILETIGTGSYGICRKVRRKRDNKVIVKFVTVNLSIKIKIKICFNIQ